MSTHSPARGGFFPRTAAVRAPWTPRVVAASAAVAVLGAALFLAGTGVVANEKTYDDQVGGMNLAILGLLVASLAGVGLLLIGRRSVAARRVQVLGLLPSKPPRVVKVPAAISAPDALVGGDGLTHFHRPECPMAADRDWPTVSRTAHERAGRRPCGVCKP